MNTQTKLNAICLFSKKDLPVKNEAEAYFTSFSNYYLDKLDYREVESLRYDQLEELLKEVDLVIFLVSVHLLPFRIWESDLIRRVISKHHLHLLSAVGIQVDKFEPVHNPLVKLTWLPQNEKPIRSYFWGNAQKAFNVIFHELMEICRLQIERKEAVVAAWKQALSDNTCEGYEAFYTEYPYSPYVEEAKKKYHELGYKKCWKEATESDSIQSYVNYLIDTWGNNRKHQFEAATKILTMENDQELRWKEVKNQGLMKFYYQFMNYYYLRRNKRTQTLPIVSNLLGSTNNEGEDKVKNYVSEAYDYAHAQPFAYKKEKLNVEKLETNYLDYRALKQRKSHEILDYQIFTTHLRQLIENSIKTVGDTVAKQTNLVVLGTTLVAVSFLVLYSLWGVLWWAPFWVGLLGFSAFYIYNCYGNIGVDIRNMKKGVDSLQILSVLLRVALVKHDGDTISSIINFSRFVERKAMDIRGKSMFNYFYHSITTWKGKEMEIPKDLPKRLDKLELEEPEDIILESSVVG